jgi:hypothetical protein
MIILPLLIGVFVWRVCFHKHYQERRADLTTSESIATLSAMKRFFGDGQNWTRWAWRRPDGSRCLLGAAHLMRQGPINDAQYWIQQAIDERAPVAGMLGIAWFNDTRRSYGEIAGILDRAKELAARHHEQLVIERQLPAPAPMRQLPAPTPVVEILPPANKPELTRLTVKRRE